ncbi:hypothetical protein BV22DRAFT_1104455 [Leucogyrophana mollusca]|uniref:Uncharacterized protein n=1 Tax=Leucogyrophana mollusca TaxID=85980 RepID=A0ACB8BM32_9AGAM|nr:hypothetical protein BV22DRAFT_1104455 [Leucogyrophana mollusca]
MPSPCVPAPVSVLTPELSSTLKERIEGILAGLIRSNLRTRFVRESPVFDDFRSAIERLNDQLLESYYATISLTDYESYEPFVSKFLRQPCEEDEVKDLFSPGLPYYIAVSSGTSGKTAKLFPKYRYSPNFAPPPSKSGGKSCVVYSLTYRQVVEVQRNDGEPAKIPITLLSSGSNRIRNRMDVDKDSWTIRQTMPGASSPVAVSWIRNYRTFLLMHAFFALADATLESFDTIFGTVFLDLIRYMEEEWATLVNSIETGELPNYEGIDHVREYLEPKLTPNPARVIELRSIGLATAQPGWLHQIWPNLKVVVAIASGLFVTVIPKMRHYLGPNVLMRSAGLGASEGYIGVAYDPTDLNLFKVTSDSIVEYLDVSLGETDASIIPAWEIEAGHQYEVVLTTYDGLWRYRLGDIIEVAGFDPCDGAPILKYIERRNLAIRLASGALGGVMTTETQLVDGILATEKTIGHFEEFTVVVDERVMPRRFGYLVEILGAVGSNAHAALERLRDELCRSNANIKRCLDQGSIGEPTIRILRPGTFSEYRKWRVELSKTGAGQIKVPVVLSDETMQQWFFERVVREI